MCNYFDWYGEDFACGKYLLIKIYKKNKKFKTEHGSREINHICIAKTTYLILDNSHHRLPIFLKYLAKRILLMNWTNIMSKTLGRVNVLMYCSSGDVKVVMCIVQVVMCSYLFCIEQIHL